MNVVAELTSNRPAAARCFLHSRAYFIATFFCLTEGLTLNVGQDLHPDRRVRCMLPQLNGAALNVE